MKTMAMLLLGASWFLAIASVARGGMPCEYWLCEKLKTGLCAPSPHPYPQFPPVRAPRGCEGVTEGVFRTEGVQLIADHLTAHLDDCEPLCLVASTRADDDERAPAAVNPPRALGPRNQAKQTGQRRSQKGSAFYEPGCRHKI